MKSIIKIIAIYLLRAVMRCLFIFPMKDNRIVINSYRGSQYSCNPKYLREYIMKYYGESADIIWAFNEPNKYEFLKERKIKLVKYSSLLRFYYEATAKVSINNIGSFSWFPIRKGQEHINTWHGGIDIKKVGLEECANNPLIKKTIELSSELTTGLLSTSKTFDNVTAMKDLGFKKNTLKFGYPRNDILFQQKQNEIDLRRKICSYFNISAKDYIILYAPTYRYNRNKFFCHPNYNSIKNILSEVTGQKTVILSRMHHLMQNNLGGKETIDATNYPDMQELLAVVDMLITDYSSSIWDYAIMEKPIYIYAPDFKEYDDERGLHVDFEHFYFPFSKNSCELESQLRQIDFETCKNIAKKFMEDNTSYEDGCACEKTVDYLIGKGLMIYENLS